MKKILSVLSLLLFMMAGSVQALVEDIGGDQVISVSTTTVKSAVAPGTWYVVYNQGRKAYLYGAAAVTSQAPMSGYAVNNGYKYLVRLVESDTEGKYYIQTAEGSYYKNLAYNTGQGVSATKDGAGLFTFAEIAEGHWAIKSTTYYMDSNGSVALGYGTSAPTSTGGNSDWAIYEVSLSTVDELSGGALVSYQMLQGGLFRIQSRGNSGQYVYENSSTHKASTQPKTSATSSRMRQMWIIEHDDNGFSLRNSYTGYYLQNDYSCSQNKYYWTIQLSPNNTSDADKYIIICHGAVKSGTNNCMNLSGGTSGLCDWKYDNDRNSEWVLLQVPSKEVDSATVKANLDKICQTGKIDLEAGAYYQFINLNGGVMTERISDATVVAQDADANAWSQYWKVVKNEEDDTYSVQNVYSGRYISRKATGVTSACGGNYTTTLTASNSRFWKIAEGPYAWETTFNFIEPNKPTTGLSVKTDGVSINSEITETSAQWIVKRVDLTDEQVAAAQEEYSNTLLLLNTSTVVLNSRLQTYFSDYACTTLKEQYQAMTDDELTEAMTNSSLPISIIRMALKIKNDTWGHREKEFRIYDYAAYSDPTKWNGGTLMGTGYQFTPQTGPTGISVKSGDIVVFYVNSTPAKNTTLEYSSVKGCGVYATRTALKRGINIFLPEDDGFIYIHHIITNTSKKLADFEPMKIHIEGGRVQGYFDITRGHTNADWKDMVENLFQDEIVHLKSKFYQYNMHYDQLLKQIPKAQLDQIDTDGTAKAIEGTLHRWDDLVENQFKTMGYEQFLDRFNCMYSASSSSTSNPYASSYGTYYPGVSSIMNYDAMTHGTEYDHGGNFWCVAHETGHCNQGLYNMIGCTEISNNNFSQINTWLQGSNTGRGGPWKEAQSSFHKGLFWQEYDLWQRSRAYFQLYLYFHAMGHDTEFYPKMFDIFRKTPMVRSRDKNNPGSGLTDYLRFAKAACDVAQADLSEFFRFWGFFVPIKDYAVDDYGYTYYTTTQEEIDQTIAYMQQYPKKLGNIMFIDERIEKYPADYPGMPDGATRLATTPGATPGNSSEVGQTGMFTMFVDDPEYNQYSCNYSTTTGKVIVSQASGKGAVGFKVYNQNHVLVNAYNTYTFYLPDNVKAQPFYIKAALGDGTDRLIYDPKDISAVADATTAEETYDASQPVYDLSGSCVANPKKGGIYIQNGVKFRMK
ncbi:MAG: M60 family metallopeptidase [Prevotellaceae bacterium]|nr:M60 family metallopeptidase [Prevotellaceae bacterium]